LKKLFSIILLLGLLLSGNAYSGEKIFSSSLTGLSFSLSDDWVLSSERELNEFPKDASDEERAYWNSILKKTPIRNFEVLYNEKYKPDTIVITKAKMPSNFYIDKKNVKSNCRAIIRVNEKAQGIKGTLYDCKFVLNRVSGSGGALYLSHKDDLVREEGDIRVNQIIFIINSEAIYFSTSCKKYCKEVTDNIYAISSTLKMN